MSKIGSNVLSSHPKFLVNIPDLDKAKKVIDKNNLTLNEIEFIQQADFRKIDEKSIIFNIKFHDVEYEFKKDSFFRHRLIKGLIEKGVIKDKVRIIEQKNQPGYRVSTFEWTSKGQKIRNILKTRPKSSKIEIEPKGTGTRKEGGHSRATIHFKKDGSKYVEVIEYEEITQPYTKTRINNASGIIHLPRYSSDTQIEIITPSTSGPPNTQMLDFKFLEDEIYNELLHKFVEKYGLQYGKAMFGDAIIIADEQLLKTLRLMHREKEITNTIITKDIEAFGRSPKTLETLIKGWKKF